jgi:dolichyl-phosphate beta-glucosyltransferase
MPALSVIIPAYNEAKRLPRTLDGVRAYFGDAAIEVIVVDDGSSDATMEVAASYPWVTALRYEPNRGKGHAVRYGILRATGDRVLFMDADLATPMEELKKLAAALDADPSCGVAIGSRPLQGSELLVRQPLFRELAGRLFNKCVQLLATPGINDTQCGFKLFPRDAAQQIFSRCQLDGFSFDVELLFLARRLGYSIAEVPVRWAHQEGAAAFATRGAYLRHGLRMLRDAARLRVLHQSVRPIPAAKKA